MGLRRDAASRYNNSPPMTTLKRIVVTIAATSAFVIGLSETLKAGEDIGELRGPDCLAPSNNPCFTSPFQVHADPFKKSNG